MISAGHSPRAAASIDWRSKASFFPAAGAATSWAKAGIARLIAASPVVMIVRMLRIAFPSDEISGSILCPAILTRQVGFHRREQNENLEADSMGIIATAIDHMIAAGMSGAAL